MDDREGDNEVGINKETLEIMENHDVDQDTAEQAQDIMDKYDLDEDDAIEISENF